MQSAAFHLRMLFNCCTWIILAYVLSQQVNMSKYRQLKAPHKICFMVQVAGFLHDQETVQNAAKAATACLLHPSRKRKLLAAGPQEVPQRFLTALQSLPAHVSEMVLRVGILTLILRFFLSM